LLKFAGLKVTCCQRKGVEKWAGIKAMLRGHPEGIETKPGTVSWNRCSGTSAINLAYHFGVKRIVLVGYDMRRVDKEDNWHQEHKKMHPKSSKKRDDQKSKNIYERFLKCLPAVAHKAKDLGLEIVNTCPESAIEVFPYMKLEDTL